jgi:hypothetical protein
MHDAEGLETMRSTIGAGQPQPQPAA